VIRSALLLSLVFATTASAQPLAHAAERFVTALETRGWRGPVVDESRALARSARRGHDVHAAYRRARAAVHAAALDAPLLDAWDEVVRAPSPRRTHRPHRTPLDEIARACDDAFPPGQEDRCLQIVRGRPDAAATVRACEAAFDGDANEEACLLASDARFPMSRAIAACEEAFDGDANELECVRHAARSGPFVADTIRACEAAFDGDANELRCVELGARPDVVRYCEENRSGDASEVECIVATRRRR